MFFIGIDVSKAKLDCCLLLDAASGKRKSKSKSKSVANSKIGVDGLLAWCAKQAIDPAGLHAIMEATGVYHEQAALTLYDAGGQPRPVQGLWQEPRHPHQDRRCR